MANGGPTGIWNKEVQFVSHVGSLRSAGTVQCDLPVVLGTSQLLIGFVVNVRILQWWNPPAQLLFVHVWHGAGG